MREVSDLRSGPAPQVGAQIRTTSRNDWRVGIELHGEFDVAVADELAGVLTDELDAGRHLLHLDLGHVTFLDCAVLGVLARIDLRCRSEHASLILVDVPHAVVRLIALCELDQVLLVSAGTGPSDADDAPAGVSVA
jgi:anti-anti-sigma factor